MRSTLLLCAALAAPAGAQDRVVAYQIVDASEIPASLTGRSGDATAGRGLYFDQRTGCSGCHGSPGGPQSAEAPRLDGVAARMSPGEIRLWLVAPDVRAPGTRMPAYYALGQRSDPNDPRYGEPALTASEIEDLVAFLQRVGR